MPSCGRLARRFRILAVMAFLSVSASLLAEDIEVLWLEGRASRQVSGSWKALAIGDRIPADATVRLEPGAVLECSGSGDRVTLSRPGNYALKALFAQARTLRQSGADKAITDLLGRLLSRKRWEQESAAGVRGADVAGAGAMDEWVVEDAASFIKEGRDLLAGGKAEEAAARFKEAVEVAEEDVELAEARYCLASALLAMGQAPAASAAIEGLVPPVGADWSTDFAVLKATVLLESGAPAEAVSWLKAQVQPPLTDKARVQAWNFILGLALRASGDGAGADRAFAVAIEAGASTPMGKAAAELRKLPSP